MRNKERATPAETLSLPDWTGKRLEDILAQVAVLDDVV